VNKKLILLIVILLSLFTTTCTTILTPIPLKKTFVACFINESPVFAGEIIGPMVVTPMGVVKFYSIELDAEVRILNGGCIEIDKNRKKTSTETPSSDPHPTLI
jgi:hypothetical protein